jgi:hypothetical protein
MVFAGVLGMKVTYLFTPSVRAEAARDCGHTSNAGAIVGELVEAILNLKNPATGSGQTGKDDIASDICLVSMCRQTLAVEGSG